MAIGALLKPSSREVYDKITAYFSIPDQVSLNEEMRNQKSQWDLIDTTYRALLNSPPSAEEYSIRKKTCEIQLTTTIYQYYPFILNVFGWIGYALQRIFIPKKFYFLDKLREFNKALVSEEKKVLSPQSKNPSQLLQKKSTSIRVVQRKQESSVAKTEGNQATGQKGTRLVGSPPSQPKVNFPGAVSLFSSPEESGRSFR